MQMFFESKSHILRGLGSDLLERARPLFRNNSGSRDSRNSVNDNQCDQIGRFIGLWATFSKPLATINLPKSPTFLGNFCKGVKIFNFSS